MNRIKKIIFILFSITAVTLISAYLVLENVKKSALPDYNQDIQIPGLESKVTVMRDSFAIPHIFSRNESDLYKAVGFVMAQDRLWQMDLLRRVTRGRLSEVMGKDQLQTDLLMRALRIEEKSEDVLTQSSPEVIKALNDFCEGVNFYINNFPLPPEFRILGYKPEPWRPEHSINLIGYMAWDLASGWNNELLLHNIKKEVSTIHFEDLLPQDGKHSTLIYEELHIQENLPEETLLTAAGNLKNMGIEIFNGSNNWAVSGKKSATGKPLLANDMHLGLFAPGIWYQMHHVAGRSLNVTGLVLPGQPFVICGHNDSIAWGMTNVAVDDIDFYVETLNDDSTRYLLDGEWRNLLIKDIKIETKEGEVIRENLMFTHRGPLVNRFKDQKEPAISIRWTGNETSNEMKTIYLLNRAANWSDFRNAVKYFKSISQNIVYADVKGNIGLQCSAGVPKRPANGINIFPGDTSLYDWSGFVPFEELPFEFNPERGYVSSANNKTAPGDYPYIIGHWYAMSDRIDRIREMLEETEKHSVEDFCRIQSDFKSKKAEKWVPEFLVALNSESGWNEAESKALEKLKTWDFKMDKESQAASVFDIVYRKMGENLVKDELPSQLYEKYKNERILIENLNLNILPEKDSPWIDNISTPEKESFSDLIILAFKETVEELTHLTGQDPENWQWGKIHTFTLSHPLSVVKIADKAFNLSRGPFPVSGSYHTACPYSYSFKNLYKVNHGASHRHIFDLSGWDNSKTIIPTGTSGIPASDFYLDQTERYLSGSYHTDPFSKKAVLSNTLFSMDLTPQQEK
ncbi:MAG: penicillin acylase family protein [Prolixibacteraceae bacterium]|nr:penicillin acylase family protein [Prolixibacteraceae bacterium]